jgi:hypothetical protein
MTEFKFLPPVVVLDQLLPELQTKGYAVLGAQDVARWAHCSLTELNALSSDWQAMPPDLYLKDGGHYRRRRHSCFEVESGVLTQVPHRAHWQSLDYNALHGGMERWFEPMRDGTVGMPAWQQLLLAFGQTAQALQLFKHPQSGPVKGCIEAHQFRIDTTDGIGRPTPEGAHRDGVDLVGVFMVNRSGIKGGETRVFEANASGGQRFTLTEPWSLLLLDDERVIHETTPIQPLAPNGHRDTLVLTCLSGAFQKDGSAVEVDTAKN